MSAQSPPRASWSSPFIPLAEVGIVCEVLEMDGAGVFRLVGEIDMSNIEAVGAGLEEAMPLRGDLTLDLSRLTFVGSEGLRLFIRVAKRRGAIGPLVLLDPSPGVRRLLDIAGIEGLSNLVIRDGSEPIVAEMLGR